MRISAADLREIARLIVMSSNLTQTEIRSRLRDAAKISPESVLECLLVLRKIHDRI